MAEKSSLLVPFLWLYRFRIAMEINVPKEGIIGLIDKLCEKIFKEDDASSQRQRDLFKVRFNKRISSHLRNIVYTGLLSREKDKLQKLLAEESTDLNVKERLSVVGYNLKTTGLINKANKLEKMVSSIGMWTVCQFVTHLVSISTLFWS